MKKQELRRKEFSPNLSFIRQEKILKPEKEPTAIPIPLSTFKESIQTQLKQALSFFNFLPRKNFGV